MKEDNITLKLTLIRSASFGLASTRCSSQDAGDATLDACHELAQFVASLQRVRGLPDTRTDCRPTADAWLYCDEQAVLPAAIVLWSLFMANMVKCIKLGREAEPLAYPPYPGELGKRIFENVSKQAWQQWLEQQKMLVNENRLSLADPKARKYLLEQTEKYFFGQGADAAAGYVPPPKG